MSVISLPTPLQTMPLHDLGSELLGLAGHIAAAEARFSTPYYPAESRQQPERSAERTNGRA